MRQRGFSLLEVITVITIITTTTTTTTIYGGHHFSILTRLDLHYTQV